MPWAHTPSPPWKQSKMWRTLDAHLSLRTLRLGSSLASTSTSTPTPTLTPTINSFSSSSVSPFRTIFARSQCHFRLPYPPPFFPLPRTHVCFSPTPASAVPVRSTNTPDFGSNFGFVVMRCVSSVPEVHTLDWNDAVSCSEVGDGSDGSVGEDAKPSIPVKAYFFSTSIDLKSLVERNKPNFVPPSSRMTNYVVLKFGNVGDSRGLGASCLSESNSCYMVVFQYGSIVLFNVPEHDVDGYLKIVKIHAAGLLPEMRKDELKKYVSEMGGIVFDMHHQCAKALSMMDTSTHQETEYEVREKPALATWMQGGLDYIMLQYLNIDGIRTIGSVLGQSIALDYYGRQVDGMVAEFTDINREMEATGKFKMQRKKLFQLVGKANSNLADVILKLGLFERSDIAWKDAKYAQIWEYLRDEFELTQRFASLDFKLKFVEHNIRFLQEILQNRKSDFLEWLIIALIGAEILLSLYDIVQRSAVNL